MDPFQQLGSIYVVNPVVLAEFVYHIFEGKCRDITCSRYSHIRDICVFLLRKLFPEQKYNHFNCTFVSQEHLFVKDRKY